MRAALRGQIEMYPVLRGLHTLFFGSVYRSHKAFLSTQKHNSDSGTIAFLFLVNAPTVPLGDCICASEDVTGIQTIFHIEMHWCRTWLFLLYYIWAWRSPCFRRILSYTYHFRCLLAGRTKPLKQVSGFVHTPNFKNHNVKFASVVLKQTKVSCGWDFPICGLLGREQKQTLSSRSRLPASLFSPSDPDSFSQLVFLFVATALGVRSAGKETSQLDLSLEG